MILQVASSRLFGLVKMKIFIVYARKLLVHHFDTWSQQINMIWYQLEQLVWLWCNNAHHHQLVPYYLVCPSGPVTSVTSGGGKKHQSPQLHSIWTNNYIMVQYSHHWFMICMNQWFIRDSHYQGYVTNKIYITTKNDETNHHQSILFI